MLQGRIIFIKLDGRDGKSQSKIKKKIFFKLTNKCHCLFPTKAVLLSLLEVVAITPLLQHKFKILVKIKKEDSKPVMWQE